MDTSTNPAVVTPAPAETTAATIATPRPDVVPLLRNDSASVLLVDVGHRMVHTVNTTAGMIWAQCDGSITVDDVTKALADVYATDPDAIIDDVIHSVSDFRQRGLLRTPDDPPFPSAQTIGLEPGPDGASYVVPEPCSCGVDLETLEWAGTVAVAVGPVRMGIRFNSDDAGERVRHALADWLVDDADAPVTYTVVLLDDEHPAPVPALRSGLYEGRRFQMGPDDHDGIIAMLTHRVETWAPLGPSEVRLAAVVVEGPSGAVLAPAFHGLDQQLTELADTSGWRFGNTPVVVDGEKGSVGGQAVNGILWPGPQTERLEADDALNRLVALAKVHPGDDIDRFVDNLDELAARVNAVITPVDQLTDVARAMLRPR